MVFRKFPLASKVITVDIELLTLLSLLLTNYVIWLTGG